jgi:aromatic ring-opening dioxygenase catalytic subunit (LigB family)
MRMPALYLPHGGGPAFFMGGPMAEMFAPMRTFLSGIAATLPQAPAAIVVVSAHWESAQITVTTGAAPGLLYDYSGFPAATYQLEYAAPGHTQLGQQCLELMHDANVDAVGDPARGWDHGVFIPLKVMFPAATIPVVAVSLKRGLEPDIHTRVGAALRPLRDAGVLLIGSGMSYHNMGGLMNGGAVAAADARAFDAWLDDALCADASRRSTALAAWKAAPSGLAPTRRALAAAHGCFRRWKRRARA